MKLATKDASPQQVKAVALILIAALDEAQAAAFSRSMLVELVDACDRALHRK